MGLKVWLPLNGDLRNLGLSDILVTNYGATVNKDGKIGSCYAFDGSSQYMELNNFTIDTWQQMSVTFWSNNGIKGIITLKNSNEVMKFHSTTNNKFYFRDNQHSDETTVSITTTIPENTWAHYAFIYDNGNWKVYINGVQSGEFIAETPAALTNIAIARICNASTTSTPAFKADKVNDFRIYDNVLSAAEIREIARGLILHYKLDGPMNSNRNYLKNLIDNNILYQACTYDYDKLTGTYTLTVTDTGQMPQIWNTNLVTNVSELIGKEVIISIKEMNTTDPNASQRAYLYYTPTSISATRLYSGENKVTIPEGITKIGLILRCDQNKTSPIGTIATFSGIKMELGNKATEWSPAPEDLGIDTTIVTDSSGYGHNAILQEGSLLSSTDTPRYNSSIISEALTCCRIQDTVFHSQHLASEFTWAGWIKRDYTTAETKYIYKGIAYIILSEAFRIRINWYHRNADGSSDVSNTWDPGIIMPYNEWVYVVFTFKDGVMKVYINGEYIKTSDRSNTGIYMRGYRYFYFPSNEGNSFIGNISDMRVYCTALLDKDIKMLYNTSSRVNNLGGIHSFELNEKHSNIFRSELISPFAKSSGEGTGEIVEKNNKMAMCIKPSPFYQNLENNDSGVLVGCFQPNTSYMFDIWMDLSEKNSSNEYVTGGFVIYYTDGTTNTTFRLSGQEGWQHNKIITPSNKTIEKLVIRYSYNVPVFYRLDSYICPISSSRITKSGILTTTNIIENSKIASIHKGGSTYSSEFIEM